MAYRALGHPMVGWIGAGRMGLQMASRLLDAGYDVAIYNRTAAKAAPMISRGAVAVDQPSDLSGRAVRDAGRKRETDFLAAPVSGNPKVVSAGTLILEQARRSDITLAAENVKVDDGLEASS
ncbi:MAG TPA: NAD(P)-binding domain-containing protein [Streptosporangiaceae bacterium]